MTISVIVHSYNRPMMLGEALRSVAAGRPDEVIIVDDGSAFRVPDVAVPALGVGCRYTVVGAPPVSIEERMTTPRQGMLINTALQVATGDVIAYLCDDDIHAPGWYDALRAAWAHNPALLLARGMWRQFTHPATPGEADPPCTMDARQMTAGNFAHHIDAVRVRGAAWPTTALNCLDHGFLCSLHAVGVDQFNAIPVGFAGWRRDHPKVNLNWSDGWLHRPAFAAVLAEGFLE